MRSFGSAEQPDPRRYPTTHGHALIYLVIPVICFVALAFLIRALNVQVRNVILNRGTRDLDVILSVLMTSGYDRSALKFHKTNQAHYHYNNLFLRLTFPGSAVRLEVPLAPYGGLGKKTDVLAILDGFGLVAGENSDGNGLLCKIEGPPPHAAAIIIEIIDALIDEPFELEVHTHNLDHDVIEKAFAERRDGEALPIAATHGTKPRIWGSGKFRNLLIPADLLLLPIPFVATHIQFGYLAASWTLIAIIIVREPIWRHLHSRSKIGIVDGLKLVFLGLAGATVVGKDPVYLQLIPTVVCLILAIVLFFKRNQFIPSDRADEFDPESRQLAEFMGRIFCFLGPAMLLGAALWNEYLRAHFSLDVWIWFFAYVRVELLVGLVGTALASGLLGMGAIKDNDRIDSN